jgi:hypothetical protein
MSSLNMKRGELPRTHRDRHPGILDTLDQPHPVERKLANVKRTARGAGRAASREASPR